MDLSAHQLAHTTHPREDSTAHQAPGVQARPVFERTLAKEVILQGIGLHTGQTYRLRLCPAAPGHGLVFFRTDLKNGARAIELKAENVSDTRLCTLLSNDQGGSVGTIEHLMAALHATGLSNALIEIDGPEIPVLDGSSAPFISAIEAAGLINQTKRQSYIRILETVEVVDGDRRARLSPHHDRADTRLLINFKIAFDAACIGTQSYQIDVTPERFAHELSAARTFGFAEQITHLHDQGLARGGHMGNAIFIENGQVANPGGLRFKDEFVRHKALDAVGDLFIEGLPLIGRFKGEKAGHEMTNRVMRALKQQSGSFEIVTL